MPYLRAQAQERAQGNVSDSWEQNKGEERGPRRKGNGIGEGIGGLVLCFASLK